MLILAGVNILEKWALKNHIPGATLLGISPTGYTNDELSMEWIRHFDIHTAGRRAPGDCSLWTAAGPI